ncbi:hypothetical protein AB0C27_24685 [Nonomuraea sp. NPDC048882]|uniref:hypothetical protein n=1 Tax=Nonomuraea sp. NPDC048882 TaxID=3154347 RepID=UPI003400C4AF
MCCGALAVFLWCGVSARDLAFFTAYLGAGVLLPGTLLWRALTGGGRSLAEELAAGLALGYAVEVLAYIPARAVGVPLLVLGAPVAVLCAFTCVPRLRRHWWARHATGRHSTGAFPPARPPSEPPSSGRHAPEPSTSRRHSSEPDASEQYPSEPSATGQHPYGPTSSERHPSGPSTTERHRSAPPSFGQHPSAPPSSGRPYARRHSSRPFPGRRRGQGGGHGVRERVPGWCAWVLAGIVAYLVGWSALFLYRVPVAAAYVDMPYHLALVGEAKHHFPLTMPSVLGEGLSYHWFVHAEMAATSWVTGIEPVTLVYRLSTLPMAAATVVLVAAIGRRLGGRWGAGVAAAGVAYFLFGPELVEDVSFPTRSMFTVWASPTQTFGALLFAAVVLLLVGEFGRRWAALAVLLPVLAGAKATYLPMLLAALLLVLAVRAVPACARDGRGAGRSGGGRWAARRAGGGRGGVVRGLAGRWRRGPWAGAAVWTLVCLLFAQFVLFGQGAQGTVVSPFATMRGLWARLVALSEPATALAEPPTALSAPATALAEPAAAPVLWLAVLTGVHLFCLACVWGGVAGLGRRVLEPALLLVLGVGAAGIGAAALLGHPAESQLYFLEAARPYLSIAAVCGVLAAPRLSWIRLACLAAAGAVAALVAAPAAGLLTAQAPDGFPGGRLGLVVLPYAVLAVAALLVWRRGHVLAVVAVLAGYAVPTSVREVAGHIVPDGEKRERLIPPGARAAGRWLREHSAPGDVVATDLHCLHDGWRVCDSRHFWVSGFSERRVLVEGWAYAESTLSRAGLFAGSYLTVPFADQARLAANDAVFRAPTAQNVRQLADRYGVTWLFTGMNPRPQEFARLRFRNACCSIYQIP